MKQIKTDIFSSVKQRLSVNNFYHMTSEDFKYILYFFYSVFPSKKIEKLQSQFIVISWQKNDQHSLQNASSCVPPKKVSLHGTTWGWINNDSFHFSLNYTLKWVFTMGQQDKCNAHVVYYHFHSPVKHCWISAWMPLMSLYISFDTSVRR